MSPSLTGFDSQVIAVAIGGPGEVFDRRGGTQDAPRGRRTRGSRRSVGGARVELAGRRPHTSVTQLVDSCCEHCTHIRREAAT